MRALAIAGLLASGCAPPSDREELDSFGIPGSPPAGDDDDGAAGSDDGSADSDGDGGDASDDGASSDDGAAIDFDPAFVDELAAQALGAGAPGLAVAVVVDGAPVHAKGYGVVQPGGAPVGSATLFNLASVTKMV